MKKLVTTLLALLVALMLAGNVAAASVSPCLGQDSLCASERR